MSEGNSRARLSIVGIIVLALFSGLFARLWFLQVGSSTETAAAQTRANRVRIITEPGVRGRILDRNGEILVENKLVDVIQVRHGLKPAERRRTVRNLSMLLGETKKEIAKSIDDPRYSAYQPVPIKTEGVTFDMIAYIKARPEQFPKVEAVRRSVRTYSHNLFNGRPLAPHLLGYVGILNKQEQKLHKRDHYAADDLIGKEGVEQMFESELRGLPRIRKIEVDSRGRLVRELSDRPAQVGNDVQLTMDANLQRVAQDSLEQGMQLAADRQDTSYAQGYKEFNASGGAAIVMDPKDGSIVALASAPEYDAEQFTTGLPLKEFKRLNDPKNHFPLLNRATQGLYAPGSTFKMVSAVAGLENKEITPEFSFDDRGLVGYGNCPPTPALSDESPSCTIFKNAGGTPHGPVNLDRALRVSSDVYFYNLGFLFWQKFDHGDKKQGYGIQRTAREFGFGKPTGIGLPNEAQGRIPDLAFKKAFNKGNPDPVARTWLPGDNANTAVGQGDVLVTPLQLAVAYSAFENGGKVFQPRVASTINTPGSVSNLRKIRSLQVGRVDLPKDVRAEVLKGLFGVVSSEEGTANASFADYAGIPVAGKTGTAEQNGKQDNALFAAMVNPEPKPEQECNAKDRSGCQYVVIVVVEEGGFGSSVAAPIARRIIDSINNPTQDPPPVQYHPQKSD